LKGLVSAYGRQQAGGDDGPVQTSALAQSLDPARR